MSAKPIMVQGTMSGAGKSLLVTGLCRILSDLGYGVAPFKAQNMALNSFVTEEGLEMGRAQVLQAQAARLQPTVDMNPILLKPTTDVGSQVIVHGRPLADLSARDYFGLRHTLRTDILKSYERLARTSDIIVIEGAGSPVELNLKRDDICNMGMAKMVESPVILVADIDPGGVFAQLVGTMVLLEDDERAMVKATVVNKFRGDVTLFDEGIRILEERCGVPVAGVIRYLDVNLEDEDSLSERLTATCAQDTGTLDVAVIRLPKLSNFTDFIALDASAAVHVRYVARTRDLGHPDLIIVPGTKATVSDLCWLKDTGLGSLITDRARANTPVIGICGGYQMLGKTIVDTAGVEGHAGTFEGLGLLPVTTTFAPDKVTRQTRAHVAALPGPFSALSGTAVAGYEIHQGQTDVFGGRPVLLREDGGPDGCQEGTVMGCYLHGLFDEPGVVSALISGLRPEAPLVPARSMDELREAEIEKLASALSSSLDMDLIIKIIEEGLSKILTYVLPQDIERRSFEIISSELGETDFTEGELMVVKRVIHATADFDFAQNLCFTPDAVEAGVWALEAGAHIVCDTTMVEAGINKRALAHLGGATHAFVGDPDVAAEATRRHTTRSAVAMERACALEAPTIFAIGNAPTALIRLCQMIEEGALRRPALVIGVPVGFVNVVESKEALEATDVERIVARGRKGGSTVAVAIANALIYCASGGRRD